MIRSSKGTLDCLMIQQLWTVLRTNNCWKTIKILNSGRFYLMKNMQIYNYIKTNAKIFIIIYKNRFDHFS